MRQVEALARKDGRGQARAVKGKTRGRTGKDSDTAALERRVSDQLGLNVSIDHKGEGGVLHIEYKDLEQLEDVLRRLQRK